MDFQNGNNKFFSYIIILWAFFVLIFFTRTYFYSLQEKLDERYENTSKLEDIKKELSELEKLKKDFVSNQDKLLKNVSKYTIDFNSKNIFNYIYTYVDKANANGKESIIMKSLNFKEGTVWDLGFTEGTIIVTARFSSQKELLKFMNYLINPNSQYSFFIDNFSYPNFWKGGSFQATIPLKMFYKK